MNIALICAKCGKVHTDNDEGTLIVDFKQKYLSFICQGKGCRHDNIFNFNTWKETSKNSPLPRIGIM